jgi:WD40 repeat protein
VLWDTATGAELSRLLGLPGDYFSPAFSPDGRLVAAIGAGRLIGWDATSGVRRFSVEPEVDFGPVTFLPDGKTLLVGEGGAERVAVYSAENGQRLGQIRTPSFVTEEMALDPTGEHVALSSQVSVEVQVWNLRTKTLEWSTPTADGGPVAWSPRGDMLGIGGANASPIRVVDGATGKDAMILRGHESGSWDVAFTAGGDRLASVGQNGGLRVWDVTPDGVPSLGALTVPGYVHSVQFSPDGSELLVSTRDGAIARLSSNTGDVLGSMRGQLVGLPPFDPRISRDGRWTATVDETGEAAIRDLATMETAHSLPPCTSPVGLSRNGSLVVLDGRLLCTADGRGVGSATLFDPPGGVDLTSRVVDVSSGETVLSLGERAVFAAAFNPEGLFRQNRYLAVNVQFTSVEIYDLDRAVGGPLTILNIDSDQNFSLTFDPTGRWLTGGTANGRVWVLDMNQVVTGVDAKDALVMDKPAHVGGVTGLAMNDSGILATASVGDGFVRLWDIASGKLELELKTDPAGGWSPVEFSPDGKTLLYNDGGVLRRYFLDTNQLIALAENRLTRPFTDDECRRYLSGRCS